MRKHFSNTKPQMYKKYRFIVKCGMWCKSNVWCIAANTVHCSGCRMWYESNGQCVQLTAALATAQLWYCQEGTIVIFLHNASNPSRAFFFLRWKFKVEMWTSTHLYEAQVKDDKRSSRRDIEACVIGGIPGIAGRREGGRVWHESEV